MHIAFFFAVERATYLREVVRGLASYRFKDSTVVVDTNCAEGYETVSEIATLVPAESMELRCVVHKELAHPHMLTWAHRAAMRERIADFDFFMYTEDDIAVPWPALVAWHRDSTLLAQHGFLRGFLRVETDAKGRLMATDLHRRERPLVRVFGGRAFFHPRRPYQGFWIYDREQMAEFLASDSWVDPPCRWNVREKAAAGMIFSNVPGAPPGRGNRRHNRVLVPLNGAQEPAPESFVYHLPCNYARSSDPSIQPRARIPVSLVTKPPLWRRLF